MNLQQIIQLQNQKNKRSNLEEIEIGVVYLGDSVSEYHPKLKDSAGNKIKDEAGRDKRSEVADGFKATFATLGDNTRIVSAVFKEKPELKLFTVFWLKGFGYNIRSSNFIWLEEVTDFKKVEQ